jgi:hypothetical protein
MSSRKASQKVDPTSRSLPLESKREIGGSAKSALNRRFHPTGQLLANLRQIQAGSPRSSRVLSILSTRRNCDCGGRFIVGHWALSSIPFNVARGGLWGSARDRPRDEPADTLTGGMVIEVRRLRVTKQRPQAFGLIRAHPVPGLVALRLVASL